MKRETHESRSRSWTSSPNALDLRTSTETSEHVGQRVKKFHEYEVNGDVLHTLQMSVLLQASIQSVSDDDDASTATNNVTYFCSVFPHLMSSSQNQSPRLSQGFVLPSHANRSANINHPCHGPSHTARTTEQTASGSSCEGLVRLLMNYSDQEGSLTFSVWSSMSTPSSCSSDTPYPSSSWLQSVRIHLVSGRARLWSRKSRLPVLVVASAAPWYLITFSASLSYQKSTRYSTILTSPDHLQLPCCRLRQLIHLSHIQVSSLAASHGLPHANCSFSDRGA